MKTRILSLVLAVIMVVSMAAMFSLSSSAEEPEYIVTVGSAYVTEGTASASVPLYIYASEIPGDADVLRSWQFAFTADIVGADGLDAYVSGSAPYGFANVGLKQYGNTANSGYNCGTEAELAAKGGFKVATLGFVVPAEAKAGDVITIDIDTTVSGSGINFESGTNPGTEKANGLANATIVAGSIYVVEEAAADAVEGAGEDLYVKAVSDDGTKLLTINEDTYTGEFANVYISAMANAAFVENFMGEAENFIIKDASFDDLMGLVDGNGVYYHKLASGETPIIDNYDGLSAKNKKKISFFTNLLQASETAVVNGNKVTFVTGIAANDLWYDNLSIVVAVDGGKTYELKDVKSVCKTLKSGSTILATTKEETATSAGIDALELGYLAGVTLSGVPAGTYTATVTLYGTTPDASGTPVVVTSEPVEVTFTVA